MKTFRHLFPMVFCCCMLLVQKASAQTQSAAAIKGTYVTIYDMLKDVPGLEVKSANGKGGTVTVRGLATLNASSQPLFVVDGSIYTGDISNLNPEDIASINVLKDAASTGAYGAQGANGVISITTKKGTMSSKAATVNNHTESAYTYFIEHKTTLKVFDMNESVIIEGIPQRQKGDSLVFIKKRKDFMVPISSIKRVEMVKVDQ